MKRLLLIAATAAMISAPASANLIFNLSGATLQYGGELTGSITLSDDLQHVVDLNISAPAADASPPYHFAAYTYTFANALIDTHLPNQYIRITEPGGYELQFSFSTFTTAGTTFITTGSSSEHTTGAGNRTITGGSFVAASSSAVPEPATWTLALAGLGLIGFGLNRRRTLSRTA